MSPEKTGAVIYVEPEGCYYRCDVWYLLDIQWFRITNASANWGVSPDAPYATIKDWAAWYDRAAVYSTVICGPGDVENY